jgi:acetoin utilization deacetylase AcuC-like enzyme
MIIFHNPAHVLHAPEHEFFRGERVPCHETPGRAAFVLDEMRPRGHALREPEHDAADVLPRVHAPRYLAFLASAWDQWLALSPANADRQPFPSVWPVRSLRSDVEPANFIARLGLYSIDNGTPMSAGTWAAAKAGADAAVSAAALLGAGTRAAFCATRPPGHHAGADFMGGYCFLNNAAIAAQALRDRGCRRVAVLDVDYHHGNGTQSLFYQRDDVLVVSLHGDPRTEYPFYLGHADETGVGAGLGHNLNLPLPAGTTAARWFEALDLACQRVQWQQVDALVVSLGLDTFAGDPISTFLLHTDDFVRVGARIAALGCPTIFVLEGGYAALELGTNAANVLSGFEGG